MSVQRADGSIHWARPGRGATTIDGDLWTILPDGAVASIDPHSGDVVDRMEMPDDQVSHLLDLGGVMGVVSRNGLTVVGPDREIAVQHEWNASLVDVARFDRGMIITTTDDGELSAYELTIDEGR